MERVTSGPEAPAGERSLFFLHIRKTAGSSVRTLLSNRFAVRDCLLDCHHVGNQGRDPGSYRFVTGHADFAYVGRFPRRPVVFVVLRRPLECVLSAYHFYRSHDPSFLRWLQDTLPGGEGAERVRFARRASELPLLQFLEAESDLARAWLSNTQTRALAGGTRPEQARRSDAELLADAARNLETCDVVGLTERLDESLDVLARRMGWDGLDPAPRENVTRGRPREAEVDPRALEILRRWNLLDAELYETGQRLFTQGRQEPDGSRERCGVPDGAAFTFDQAIHGRGWYPRENVEGGWLCWTGAGREAWLDLHVPGVGEHTLRCRGVRVLRQSVLDGLRVHVNGQPVSLVRRGRGRDVTLEARVPARLLDPNTRRVRLTFVVNETFRPCDLVPDNPDRRPLGLALDGVEVVPLGG